jgi:fused signal recognition particle receptor
VNQAGQSILIKATINTLKMGFFDKFFSKDKKEDLDKGLEKTKERLSSAKSAGPWLAKARWMRKSSTNLESTLDSPAMWASTQRVKIIERIEARAPGDKST